MARDHVAARCDQLAQILPWVIFAALIWTAACVAPLDSWAQPRLAAAYALAGGLELYPDLRNGAQLCWLYGPGFALWMLPVTVIPSLAWAQAVAVIANAAAPLAALVWCLRPGAGTWQNAWALAGWTVLLLSGVTFAAGWFGGLHVDPLCLTLLLVTVGAAQRHQPCGRNSWLHLAALSAVLAVWTKQNAALFPVLLAAYWCGRQQASLAGKWLILCAVYGTIISLLIGAWFGFERVWFYTVTIHTLLPWRDPAGYFAETGPGLLRDLLPWLALALLPIVINRLRPAPAGARAPDHSTELYAWLGLAALPFGFAAVLKEGGGFNSAHGFFFVAMAIAQPLQAQCWSGPRRLALVTGLGILALVTAVDRLERWTPDPYQDDLLAVARSHPGRLYLPWNPLITLITDGKIYPFEYALYARAITGTALTAVEIRAALPPEPIVLYDPLAATRTIGHYLPEARPVTLPALKAAAPAMTPR
jgi:hypothetical protein